MINQTKTLIHRLPDVYVVGAQKCGTTSLFDWIAQHPNVYGNRAAKDIPFFAMDSVYSKGVQHLANFSLTAPDDSLVLGGEVSAMFLRSAVVRLHATIPNAKLIVAIRNPVDRAYSAWHFAVERGVEDRTFEQSIEDEIRGIPYEVNVVNLAYKDYLARGKYADQLEYIFQYFPREQVHVIIFEEMRNDPATVVSDVCDFLRIKEFIPEFNVKNVTQGGARFKWIQRLLYIPRSETDLFARIVRVLMPYKVRFVVRNILERVNRVPRKKIYGMSSELRQRITDYFVADMQRLPTLLGSNDFEVMRKLGWGK